MIIRTERLSIRPPHIEDWQVFNALQSNPVYWRYLPPKPLDPEEDRRIRFRLTCEDHNDGEVHMICRNEDDSVIGWCFLNQTRRAKGHEIAMTIHRDYWNQGYATEVFEALLEVAKEADCIDRLWEQVHVGNQASLSILRKFGFQQIDDDRLDFRSFVLDVSGS